MGVTSIITKIPYKRIPWKKISTHGPEILIAVREFYEIILKYFGSTEKKPKEKLSLLDLEDIVAKLEYSELEQSKLMQNIANQLNDITKASKIISNRFFISLYISIIALIVSLMLFAKFINLF